MKNSDNGEILTIVSFSDPLCTWCWGSEPVFRALETHFPGRIRFEFVMGGLVKDARNFADPQNSIGGGDMEEYNRQVAAHWEEASARHGMPVDTENFHLFNDSYDSGKNSTYPQNIAYTAAQLADSEKANGFLYNLRAASAAEAKLTNDMEVLTEIAVESGIDAEAFRKQMESGAAEEAFKKDLEFTRAAGVTGFPTFLVDWQGERYIINGYRTYSDWVKIIEEVTKGALKPIVVQRNADSLLDFMHSHPLMAGEEIRQAFDLSNIEAAKEFIAPLAESGKLTVQQAGNGWFAHL